MESNPRKTKFNYGEDPEHFAKKMKMGDMRNDEYEFPYMIPAMKQNEDLQALKQTHFAANIALVEKPNLPDLNNRYNGEPLFDNSNDEYLFSFEFPAPEFLSRHPSRRQILR